MSDVHDNGNGAADEPQPNPNPNPKGNSRYAEAPYEVGKGKPPVEHQFKVGGKPGPGRRKKPITKSDFDEVFDEIITIGEDRRGRPIRRSARRVSNMMLRKLVLEGNLQAIKFMKMHELRLALIKAQYTVPPLGF